MKRSILEVVVDLSSGFVWLCVVTWWNNFLSVSVCLCLSLFVSVCLCLSLFVCLSVCHTIFGHSFQATVLKFYLCVGDRPRMAPIHFGEDMNPDPDLRTFQVILHLWEIGPKTINNSISQKVMDGFTRNLVDRLGEPLWKTDSILLKIRIQTWIGSLFNF